MCYYLGIEYFYSIAQKLFVVVLHWFLKSTDMIVANTPKSTKEEQRMLFSYLDTVLVDFDKLEELKKEKKPAQKRNKKPGNK